MKRFLTPFFVLCGFLTIIIGFRFQVRWIGIVTLGVALIFLIIAACCIKFIPEKNHTQKCGEKK